MVNAIFASFRTYYSITNVF